MKIYTKTGDKGTTGLFGGERVSKDNARIEAYGTIDELNSNLGYLLSKVKNTDIELFLNVIQKNLFTIGSQLATPNAKKLSVKPICDADINEVETNIDKLESRVDPLQTFILPGGHEASAYCQVVRTVCRRAERRVVTLSQHTDVAYEIMHYLNRLSDYLFVLSRALNKENGVSDIPWIPE